MGAIDRGSPEGLFGRVGLIGHPWHGLVRGGLLALPNGHHLPYRQPAGTPWECTRTLRLAVPGVPSVERNETALADDQAAGRQWLSHAYLSGADQQLYRLPLGGGRYIWIDDAGARWLVDATALHGQEWRPDAPPPAAVTITLTRFGVFTTAPAPAPVSLTVAVPDLGQDVPDLGDQAYVSSLYSVCPRGADAVFALVARGAWPTSFASLGWYALVLSGTGNAPVASIELIAGRMQTLGGDGWLTETGGFVGSRWALEGGDSYLDSAPATPPECADEILRQEVWLSDALVSEDWVIDPVMTGARLDAADGEMEISQGWAGMIVGIHHDAGGQRVPLTLDVEYRSRHVASTVFPDGLEGRRSDRLSYASESNPDRCVLSGSVMIEDFDLALTRSDTVTETVSVIYHGADGDVRIEWRYHGQQSHTLRFWSKEAGLYGRPTAWERALVVEHSLTGPGIGPHLQEVTGSATWGSEGDVGSVFDVLPGTIISTPAADMHLPAKRLDVYSAWPLTAWPMTLEHTMLGGTVSGYAVMRPCCLGFGIHGVLARTHNPNTGVGRWEVTPDVGTWAGPGLAAGYGEDYVSAGVPNAPGGDLFMARHPDSGEIATDTEPVCWV